MSDQPDRSEKQFDPTPQRLRKAREDGNVSKSRELVAVAILASGFVAIWLGMGPAFATLKDMMALTFLRAPSADLSPTGVQALLVELGGTVGMLLGPLLGLIVVAALGSSLAQTGWHPTAKPLQPKGNRISPLAGLKRLFSAKGLFDTGKAIVKAAVVLPVAWIVGRAHLDELLGLPQLMPHAAFVVAGSWFVLLVSSVLAALVVLGAADFAFERWKWKRDLKMTHKEVKDENKQMEGDPHQKAFRRQKAREMARRPRLDHAVLQADVVITNPTHYAVALRYRAEEGAAPRVVVKGTDRRAQRIKAMAAEHTVPTVEDVPLARALHAAVPEGHEIPEELFAAVAAVLAEVYKSGSRDVGR